MLARFSAGATDLSHHGLQEHRWVTKGDADPLLSVEENCSDLVEPPNDLELNHAVTQKMSHLFYVVSVQVRTRWS